VAPGMPLDDIVSLFGLPVREQRLVPDRVTHEFAVGESDAYRVSATVHTRSGLVHLSVIMASLVCPGSDA
jgi:hypothetical protein